MTHANTPGPGHDRLRDPAQRSPEAVSRMLMGQIATNPGMTQMTLYRQAGSREVIVASFADAGETLPSEPSARERAIEITAELYGTMYDVVKSEWHMLRAFLGPLTLHLTTFEQFDYRLDGTAPDRDTTFAHLTEMLCPAVGADRVPVSFTQSR